MNQIIALFFILVFSTQVIPIVGFNPMMTKSVLSMHEDMNETNNAPTLLEEEIKEIKHFYSNVNWLIAPSLRDNHIQLEYFQFDCTYFPNSFKQRLVKPPIA